jgi:hypothetical protein
VHSDTRVDVYLHGDWNCFDSDAFGAMNVYQHIEAYYVRLASNITFKNGKSFKKKKNGMKNGCKNLF